MRSIQRLGPVLSAVLSAVLAGLLAVPAAAVPFPSSIPLPDLFQPEGIAIGPGTTFYVGSLVDGDIYRGDLRSGEGNLFIDVSGRQAAGMEVDRRRHLLVVAGGFTGHGYFYDLRTGATVADVDLGGVLVNDVAVTRRAAYFTDSFLPRIYRVPISPSGAIGTPSVITVTGPAGATGPAFQYFGLNGIKATANGKVLLVNHSVLGILATVDPATGASEKVAGVDLSLGTASGTADGLILDGRTAWVVLNFSETLVEVRLSPDLSSGAVTATVTDPLFRIPTTLARHGDRLAVVNGRFDVAFPPQFGGPPPPPGTDYDVVVVRDPT